MQFTDFFFLKYCIRWLLVPSEWPHAEKVFILHFPKYIQSPLKERNVSHNLDRKENAPIITQWFYITNMSLASSAYNYKIKVTFSFVYQTATAKSFPNHQSFPQWPLGTSEGVPGCSLPPVQPGTSPQLWPSTSGVFVVWPGPYPQARNIAALSHLLLLLPDLLGETLILQSCSTSKGQARATTELPNMPTDGLSAKRTKVTQARCEKGGHHLHRGSAAS